MDIQNSVVVITSAGTHLGQNLAQHFLSLNANIILVDINKENLSRAVQHCQAHSQHKVFPYLLEDHSFDSVQPLFLSINQQFPQGIDVLINLCPNLPSPSLMDNQDLGQYSNQISMLVAAMMCFSKLAAKQMLDNQKRGVIVNLSGQDHNQPYQPSSLITEFTKSWANELMPFNIRVGGILANFANKENSQSDWAHNHDELIRNAEYIVENDYFNGRVLDTY